ncbi:helix-turn-helix transcriptional regulator [Actinocorallia populi]|uniref:helix-turn-helix transcriptional regulator n=1 Tax=Actinocorallia populi TaxID=2079200 RepID=UPI000D08D844|nr:LuxR C-terminal-related transcriptional regulator [Actinocorallia populi]
MLSVALCAVLARGGFPATCHDEEALAPAVRAAGGAGRLVIVADSDGGLPDPRPVLVDHPGLPVIAIAGRSAFAALADLVADRAVSAVLAADAPFAGLVAALGVLLLQPPGRCAAHAATVLREREEEARRFARLTRREREVMAALLEGRSAAEIAAAEHLSMPTVRSHLRAVLTKLRVTSQLAAVAMAHRSCREPALAERAREVHQF